MTKLILLALLLSAPLFAQDDTPVITSEAPQEELDFNPRKSHWISTFGFEGLTYEVPYDFQGVKKNFKESTLDLWGGRLGLGGEIYLGAGFMTTTKVEGYYVGTLFSQVQNAGPDDDDIEFAFSKKTGQVYGVDASQALGFMFDMKTKNPFMDEMTYLTVEPFVEIGIGWGAAYNRLNYDYNTGSSGTMEGYKMTVKDQLVNARVGAGINFTSGTGYFLYLRGTVNSYDVTERKTEEFTKPNMQAGTTVKNTDKNVKIDPVTIYAIGGGYKF